MDTKEKRNAGAVNKRIRKFILDDHPCVMAQSVVADHNLTLHDYELMNLDSALKILKDIEVYLQDVSSDSMKFQTFIATFSDESFNSELEFETALWNLLYDLHKLDGKPWDQNTSSDPASPNFSFSLLGHSFYIVGMHPKSSRKARSTPYPMMVFNLHNQFDLLRNVNRYDRVRDLIRRRDKAFQGSINPMLEDFGTNSEARQYSGRKVDESWKCPFNFGK